MSETIYHIHHVTPKHTWKRLYGSLNGVDNLDNLIKLTTSEHASWHYEQWVYFGYHEDWLAWRGLSGRIGKDEIFLEKCRISGLKQKGENNPFYGKTHSVESNEKNRLAHLGKKMSQDFITNMKSNKRRLGKNHSNETKEKIRSKHIGKKHSDETKQKMKMAHLGKKRGPYKIKPGDRIL